MRLTLSVVMLTGWSGLLAAQDSASHAPMDHAHMDHAAHHKALNDSAYTALQQRGGVYMGVDQNKSAHRFDTLADGGRIELQSSTGDSADVAAIRSHFRQIAAQFNQGDFATPFAVHAEKVPGTEVMTRKKDRISYQLVELPRGAQLRLTTKDPEAQKAIAEFMKYQRTEHRAPGAE
jgi:TusA-related sulfurtransferase